MTLTRADRALLVQSTWTADELVSIAFLARRLLAENDDLRGHSASTNYPGTAELATTLAAPASAATERRPAFHSLDCLDAYPVPCICGVGDGQP